MNLDNYIGYNPTTYNASLQGAKKIAGTTRSTTIAQATQALANQTGGNMMGFTYE